MSKSSLMLNPGYDGRAAALALMPEIDPRPAPARRHRHRVLMVVSTLISVSLLAGAVLGSFAYASWVKNRDPRSNSPVASLSPVDLTTYHRFAAATATLATAPVVLTYHDIQKGVSGSDYIVTPSAFAAQMRMLAEAGYHTLTAAQFTAYQAGRAKLQGHSVLITFDDGTSGLWTYADNILSRYKFHAVSFIITGRVGTHRPYYLTWAEVQKMYKSGRWDFESHTRNLHSRRPTGTDGKPRSDLANRLYVAGTGEESLASYASRVTADLTASKADITGHGLPEPTLFAWPYSDLSEKIADNQSASVVRGLVNRSFEASFTDVGNGPQPVSRREAADQLIERLELRHKSTAMDLFNDLKQMQTLSPSAAANPLSVDRRWLERTGEPAPVDLTATSVTVDAFSLRHVSFDWAPQRTADWTDYETTVTTSGLSGKDLSAGLRVRVRSGDEAGVIVSAGRAVVQDAQGKNLGTLDLTAASHHTLKVQVREGSTRYFVDGMLLLQTVNTSGVNSTGGFGLVAGRGSVDTAFPAFTQLHVAEIAG